MPKANSAQGARICGNVENGFSAIEANTVGWIAYEVINSSHQGSKHGFKGKSFSELGPLGAKRSMS
jgi:hypothetical protein